MERQNAICPYCGQTLLITSIMGDETRDEQEAAIGACDCDEAIRWRALKRFEENAGRIMGPDAEKNGFCGPLSDAIREEIVRAAGIVYNAEAVSITIQITDTERAQVKAVKGSIRLIRREVRERS